MKNRIISLVLAFVLAITSIALIAHATPNTTTCEHEFTYWKNTTSHWAQCSICGDRQNEQAHTFEVAKSETMHYNACTVCGYIKDSQEHTFEVATSAVAHYNACSVCGYIKDSYKHLFENGVCECGYQNELVAHKCAIGRATEGYHRYECDECENYTRVNHDENTLNINAKNEFFHSRECVDCGYAYTERHDFRTAYDTTGHYDVCVDCGYKTTTVAHIMADYFTGYKHDIECEECPYQVARHIGVKYTPVDQYSCKATCSECDKSAYVEHEWSSFVCDNCGYALDGNTIGMVTDMEYYEEGYYIFFLTANGEEEFVFMPGWKVWNVVPGDVIRIDHYGDTIWGIDILVDSGILNDVDNFENYISNYITEKDAGLIFDDLIAYRIEYYEPGVDVHFSEGARTLIIDKDYVVFNLTTGEISDLEEDCAYITYFAEDLVYFFCIW